MVWPEAPGETGPTTQHLLCAPSPLRCHHFGSDLPNRGEKGLLIHCWNWSFMERDAICGSDCTKSPLCKTGGQGRPGRWRIMDWSTFLTRWSDLTWNNDDNDAFRCRKLFCCAWYNRWHILWLLTACSLLISFSSQLQKTGATDGSRYLF